MRNTRRRAMLSSISALPFEWVKYLCNKSKIISNTVEQPIKEFTFYGDSTQSGTPTPESPVPIVSIVNPKAEVAPLTRVELDPDLELRGIPQLDANNNLYYDGDEYESNGTVTRKFGIVDLGTLTWSYNTTAASYPFFMTDLPNGSQNTAGFYGVCEKYVVIPKPYNSLTSDKMGGLYGSTQYSFSRIAIRDSAYTNATTFKAAMSGVMLVYELATPTTESADPYITPVAVNPLGTEEFVDERDVPIPVGHETAYADGETTVTDKVPYLFRRVPAGNKKTEKIVGGSVPWNQLISESTELSRGVTKTFNNNKIILNGTATQGGLIYFIQKGNFAGHKLLITSIDMHNEYFLTVARDFTHSKNISATSMGGDWGNQIISIPSDCSEFAFYLNFSESAVFNNFMFTCIASDLTLMFGSTIADYIYSLEQTTTGAGVAWFKALFPKDYYPYNIGQLMSVKTSANVMTGINQFDVSTALMNKGLTWADGTPYSNSKSVVSDYIRVTNATYFTNYKAGCFGYDANKNYIGALRDGAWVTTTGRVVNSHDISGVAYVRFWFRSSANDDIDLTTVGDICLNFSDPSVDGTYVPYKISKTIAATYTLRGIGDAKDTLTVRSDGTGELVRRIGERDLGNGNWQYAGYFYMPARQVDRIKPPKDTASLGNYLCSPYSQVSYDNRGIDKTFCINDKNSIMNAGTIMIYDSTYDGSTIEAFRAAMSGVIFYYEMPEPVTTQLTPEEVAAILNNATSYDVNTSITASNDSNIDQQFAITIAQEADPVLNNNSWEFISAASTSGNAKKYWSVGDTKKIKLQGTCGTLDLDTTVNVFILGFNHNAKLEGKGITFGGFKLSDGTDTALVDSHYSSNSTDGSKWFNMSHWGAYNYGGWAGCDMRYDILGSTDVAPSGYGAAPTTSRVGYDATSTCATSPVANTLMSCLPSDLRAVMKPMTKYTDNASGGSHNTEAKVTASVDYLPLLAEYEIFGARSYANEHEYKKQAQYAYYVAGNSKVKYQHSSTGSTANWWERSPYYDMGGNLFCYTRNNGGYNIIYAQTSIGLAPIFLV